MTFELLLVGHGNVARRFVELLDEQSAVRARVVGVATRRHGYSLDRRTVTPPSTVQFIRDAVKSHAAAAREGRLVVVETTTLDIEKGEPATSHVLAALAGGAHVVTANKGPAAFAYRRLARAAEKARRRFLFEGAVMDGVPIFNLVRRTLPAVQVLGFRGVVNSTTNFIITALEQGRRFGDALAEMQARGIAEADASLDVDGWDAAAKTAALANVLLGANITPRHVERHGINTDTGLQARNAHDAGRRLKLVARAERDGPRVRARVSPEELPGDDLLAGVEGQQNALILQTDLLEEIAIVQRGGSLTQTAYALLSDLISIAEDVSAGSATRRSPARARGRRTL